MERTVIIRKRKRNGVNYFSYKDYNALCEDIKGANHYLAKQVIVTVSKGKTSLGSQISQILKENRITVKNWRKYASTNNKILMFFNSSSDALKAVNIINSMAFPDYIDPDNINSDGTVTSANGVELTVDMEMDGSGVTQPSSAASYRTAASISAAAAQPEATVEGTSSSTRKWIIAVSAAAALVLVFVILKKKK